MIYFCSFNHPVWISFSDVIKRNLTVSTCSANRAVSFQFCCRVAGRDFKMNMFRFWFAIGSIAESYLRLDLGTFSAGTALSSSKKLRRVPFSPRRWAVWEEKIRAFGLGPGQFWRCLAWAGFGSPHHLIIPIVWETDRRGCLWCLGEVIRRRPRLALNHDKNISLIVPGATHHNTEKSPRPDSGGSNSVAVKWCVDF